MIDVLVFLICMVDALCLLVLSVYFIILLSDLECDYLNTKQGCMQLNKWVLPELVGSTIIPILLILTWHWIMFIVVAPLSGHLICRYVKLPLGNMGIFDPTDIRNRGMLPYFQKEAFVKIAYNLIIFFISLFGFILTLVN